MGAGTGEGGTGGRSSRVISNSLVASRTSASASESESLSTKRTRETVRVSGCGALGVVTLASHSAGGGPGLNLGVAGE